jgi:hypothetical protein
MMKNNTPPRAEIEHFMNTATHEQEQCYYTKVLPNIIAHLLTQIDALREAALPFSNAAKFVPNDSKFGLWTRDGSDGMTRITAADLHAAQQALAQTEHLAQGNSYGN